VLQKEKQFPFWSVFEDPREERQLDNKILHWVVLCGAVTFSWFFLHRLGFPFFLGALVGLVLVSVYAMVSFKFLPFPFAVWLVSAGGFSNVWSIQTAGLPDFYIDRLALIWLALVFGLKFIIEGRRLRLPVALDWVLIVYCMYLFVRMVQGGSEFFAVWLSASFVPLVGYFLAKNIITNAGQVRRVFVMLLLLSIYYNITSVAEKFNINWLIWPKYMLEEHPEFVGRSNGPFRQGPLFGTIIGMMLPIHLYFIHTVKRSVVKLILFVSLAVGFAGLYFSYTRGAWLAGIVALAATIVVNRTIYWRSMAPLLILVPVLAFSFLGLGQDNFMKERLEDENTIEARIGVMVTAARMWRDYPLTGAGFFKFKERREDYVQAVNVPGFGSIKFLYFRETSLHDIYLGQLAEVGLIGTSLQFASYFLILRMFLMKLGLARERRHYQRYLLPVMAGIFIGFLVGAMIIDFRYFRFIWILFMASVGMMAGYDPAEDRDEPIV
jgi:uncharacterized membrane protein